MGGGTGGHVTPIRPVLVELKKLNSNIQTHMIGHRGDGFSDRLSSDPNLDGQSLIFAGKWRRYANRSKIANLLDIKMTLLNVRDVFYIGIGFVQALWILKKFSPDAVFIKGGYVGVPVGLACQLLKIEYITHDSDALPGLANRFIAPKASLNAVGAPASYYSYPESKIKPVGVPIASGHAPSSAIDRKHAKSSLNLDPGLPVLLVTGGSLGARRINNAILENAEAICSRAQIVHITGASNLAEVNEAVSQLPPQTRGHYRTIDFTDKMTDYIKAADLVVTRAGATSVAELCASAKPAVFIPAAQLADQIKNVDVLRSEGLEVVMESEFAEDSVVLADKLISLLSDTKKLKFLSEAALKNAKPRAARDIAEIIVSLNKSSD